MSSKKVLNVAENARNAGRLMLSLEAETRTVALKFVMQALLDSQDEIFKSNAEDISNSQAGGLSQPLLKRLKFDKEKMDRICDGIETLIHSQDYMGMILEKRELDSGLVLSRVAGPIGVIGMVFESRPDALIQIATLCIRSGNAVILKGGSEAKETNRILARLIHDAAVKAGLPEGWLYLLETREDVTALLALDKFVDLIIPRGSNQFVSSIMKNSSIPVMGHADGICHVYLDESADVAKAVPIVLDSKMQYTAVCNATETLLVHQKAADRLLLPVAQALAAAGCSLRGCSLTQGYIDVQQATEEDWYTEYMDAVLAIRIVRDMDEAIDHIHRYGSGHTDAIVTEDERAARIFLNRIDSADVFHNCSTRFSDGFVFGLGAEVGISTSKLHARGPVGVKGLLSYRWLLQGDGHIIADYNNGVRSFTHKDLEL